MGALDKVLRDWMAKRRPDAQGASPEEALPRELRTFTLGGKRFTEIDFDRRTVLIDHYLMRFIRAHRIDTVLPREGETDNGYFVRVQTAVIDSNGAHELLAGFLLPEKFVVDGRTIKPTERDWTHEMAKETAEHIGHRCQSQADRELVLDLCTEVIFAFFAQGVGWLRRSLDFLQTMDVAGATPPSIRAMPTTGNGQRSSALWRRLTSTVSSWFRAGR